MSQMFAESVGVDFNVGGNFSASLSQMVGQAEQFARSSDTMIGVIGKLNIATVGLINSTAKLTGVHKVATAEAASYQQQLAGIEATAKVTGQSFTQLSNATLALARNTGNLGQSVRVVEALSQSGVTATKSIESLSKVWTQLGQANGLDPVALGAGMLNLNRTFGNSEATLRSYGDVLTSVTKKYGASADATLSFANALAPVAHSVGMSEQAVLGLATAASRVGADGTAAVTAFSKVLLDMQRSVRDGTPEIRTYAATLGMTTDSLRSLFQSDPTEVLVRFTNAIRTGGPQASRVLEQLGLDSTRTLRSLQAVAQGGNLGQIINQATASFGGGSTAKAAETAMSGVNEQFAKLNETLAQTVQAAGAPFLGWLKQVLQIATSIAEVIHTIIASSPVQAIGAAFAPLRMLGGIGATAVTALGIAGIGRQLLVGRRGAEEVGGLAGMIREFRGGAAGARGVEGAAGRGLSGSLGALLGPALGIGLGSESTRLGGRNPFSPFSFGAAALGLGNWAGVGIDTLLTRPMDPLRRDRGIGGFVPHETPYTVAGQAARGRWSEIFGAAREGFKDYFGGAEGGEKPAKNLVGLGDAVKAATQNIGTWAKEVTLAKDGVTGFGASLRRLLAQTAIAGGQAVGGGLGMLGRGLGAAAGALGVSSLAVGVGAGVGIAGVYGFSKLMQAADDAGQAWDKATSGLDDVYGSFNSFAAASGLATRGVEALAQAATKTAAQIAGMGTPGQVAAGNLTPEQVAYYSSKGPGGFKPTWSPAQGSTTHQAVLQTAGIIAEGGPNMSPADKATLEGNLIAKYGPDRGQKMFKDALALAAKPQDLQAQTVQEIRTTGGGDIVSTVSAVGQALGKQYGEVAGAQANRITAAYGPEATNQANARGAAQMYTQALAAADNPVVRKALAPQIAQMLGMDKAKGGAYIEEALSKRIPLDQLGQMATSGQTLFTGTSGLTTQGGSPVRGGGAARSAPGVAAPGELGILPQAAALVAAPLRGEATPAEQSVRAFDKLVGRTSTLGDALYGFEAAARKNQSTVEDLSATQVAAMNATQRAVRELEQGITPGRVQAAGGALTTTALRGAGGNVGTAILQLQQALQAANDAGDTNRATGIQAAITNLQQGRALYQQQTPAFQTQVGQMIGGIRTGTLAARAPAGEAGSQQETDRQAAIAAGQQNLQSFNDFEKQFLQANKDLNRQWARQQEDAQIQISRSEEDFHTQRLRALRDFNIQQARMVQDAAKTLYDPYQRVMAQSFYDTQNLLINIGEQNQMILRQTSQVRQLRRMGLSQGAVDTLSLMDPKNAQQVSQLLADAAANPAFIRQINASINQRLGATRDFTINENNVTYRRAHQDFTRSMHDTEADFRRSLSRMNEDLARSHERALEDLAKMGDQVAGTLAQVNQRFINAVKAMPGKAQQGMADNLRTALEYAVTSASGDITVMLNPWGKKPEVQVTYIIPTAAGHRLEAGRGAGGGPNNFTAPAVGANVRQSLPHNLQEAFDFAAKEDYHASHNWHGMCDNFVAQTWGLAHSGYATAKSHWAGIPPGYKGGGTPPAGALVFWGNGTAGHVALSAGGGNVWSTDFVRDGQVDIARVNDISKQWGGYLGWSYPYFSGKTAPIALGEGGLAMRRGRYELAERGTGEAVIPLNERGARVLAETMVRYVDQSQVAAARTQPYASHTVNGQSYTYDQRVMVTGPVTVPAEDPMRFARAMEERARQARLVQPVGRES